MAIYLIIALLYTFTIVLDDFIIIFSLSESFGIQVGAVCIKELWTIYTGFRNQVQYC